MKKVLLAILVVVLLFSFLAGCDKTENNKKLQTGSNWYDKLEKFKESSLTPEQKKFREEIKAAAREQGQEIGDPIAKHTPKNKKVYLEHIKSLDYVLNLSGQITEDEWCNKAGTEVGQGIPIVISGRSTDKLYLGGIFQAFRGINLWSERDVIEVVLIEIHYDNSQINWLDKNEATLFDDITTGRQKVFIFKIPRGRTFADFKGTVYYTNCTKPAVGQPQTLDELGDMTVINAPIVIGKKEYMSRAYICTTNNELTLDLIKSHNVVRKVFGDYLK